VIKRQSVSDTLFDTLVGVITVAAILVTSYPLYFVVIASFSNPDAVNAGQVILLPKGINLSAYQLVFNYRDIWIGYRNTIVYTVLGTLLALVITLPSGYALSRDGLPGRKFLMGTFVFTMYFSAGLIPTYIVVRTVGLYDKPYTLIVLGSFYAFNMILTRTYFKATIPQELIDAASIDGCSTPYLFVRVILPISKAIIAVVALYYAVGHWNSYFNALIYVSTGAYRPLQLVLLDLLVQTAEQPGVGVDAFSAAELRKMGETMKYASIIVSTVPIIMFYPLIQKHFVKGVMIGSIKG